MADWFVLHQAETSLRWRPLPSNLSLEVGLARTFLGRFATSAPNAMSDGDPTYVYTQLGFEI